jgi:hypothetical protein
MVLALSTGLSALPALAQHGPHGHHGPGGDPLAHTIGALKAQLNLTASQQQMLDAAVAAGQQSREASRQSRQTVKQLAHDELAKPAPDLARNLERRGSGARCEHRCTPASAQSVPEPLCVVLARDKRRSCAAALAKRMERMESFQRAHARAFWKDTKRTFRISSLK